MKLVIYIPTRDTRVINDARIGKCCPILPEGVGSTAGTGEGVGTTSVDLISGSAFSSVFSRAPDIRAL